MNKYNNTFITCSFWLSASDDKEKYSTQSHWLYLLLVTNFVLVEQIWKLDGVNGTFENL